MRLKDFSHGISLIAGLSDTDRLNVEVSIISFTSDLN